MSASRFPRSVRVGNRPANPARNRYEDSEGGESGGGAGAGEESEGSEEEAGSEEEEGSSGEEEEAPKDKGMHLFHPILIRGM